MNLESITWGASSDSDINIFFFLQVAVEDAAVQVFWSLMRRQGDGVVALQDGNIIFSIISESNFEMRKKLWCWILKPWEGWGRRRLR